MINQIQVEMEKKKLIGILELVKKSFQLFKERIGPILAIFVARIVFYLLAIIPIGAISFIFGANLLSLLRNTSQAGVSILIFIAIFIVVFFGIVFIEALVQAALISAIGEQKSFGEAIKTGWKKAIPLALVLILFFLIIIGGIILFVIPAIIFAVWFNFVTYAVVLEGKKGFSALSFSRQLVSGHWWEVFWRNLVLFLLVFVISLILNFIPWLGNILSGFFSTNFPTIFGFLIYTDLKRTKGI